MVHAADRPAAVNRLRRALDEMVVGGLQTDLGFHRWLVEEPSFVSGDYDTGLIGEGWGTGPQIGAEEAGLAAFAATQGRASREAQAAARGGPRVSEGESAWARLARREAVGE